MGIVLGLLQLRYRLGNFTRLEVEFAQFKPQLQIVRVLLDPLAALVEFVSLALGLDSSGLFRIVGGGK